MSGPCILGREARRRSAKPVTLVQIQQGAPFFMTREELLRGIAAQQPNVPEGFIRLRYHHDGGDDHYHVSYDEWDAIYPIERAVRLNIIFDF